MSYPTYREYTKRKYVGRVLDAKTSVQVEILKIENGSTNIRKNSRFQLGKFIILYNKLTHFEN